MDAFVRSFVGKVHKHVEEGLGSSPPTGDAIQYLLPILRPSSPSDVVEKVVSSLYTITADPGLFEHEFKACNGMRTLLSFMGEFDPRLISPSCRKDICRIVCLDATYCASELSAILAQGVCGARLSEAVLDWFRICIVEDAVALDQHFLLLVSAIQAVGFHTHALHPLLFEVLKLSTFVGPTSLLLSECLLSSFWHEADALSHFHCNGGMAFVSRMARMRNNNAGHTSVCSVLQFISRMCLVEHEHGLDQPTWDTLSPDETEVIAYAITLELVPPSSNDDLLLPVMRNPVLSRSLSACKLFLNTIISNSILGETSAEFDECVQTMVSHRSVEPSSSVLTSVLSMFRNITGSTRRLHYALLAVKLVHRDEVAPHMSRFLDMLGRVCRVCPEQAKAFDEECLVHLMHLWANPKLTAFPLSVRGATSSFAFHMADSLCGAAAGAWMGNTESGAFMVDKMGKEMRALAESPTSTPGELKYVDSLQRKFFHLEQVQLHFPLTESKARASFLTCPVTLDWFHCPVTASDGTTYELSSMVQLHRQFAVDKAVDSFLSPMTRERLHESVTYNRTLKHMEEAVVSMFTKDVLHSTNP